MRYYSFTINTNAQLIKEKTKVRLSDYCYDSPIAAATTFVHKNTNGALSFLIYDVKDETAYAAFSFDEQKTNLQSAYDEICGLLKDNFDVGLNKTEPSEITMLQYTAFFVESRRHDYTQGSGTRIADAAHLWPYYLNDDIRALPFEMEESIASLDTKNLDIYDNSFKSELARIEASKLPVAEDTNMAHYFISGNSRQAEFKLAESLVNKLFKANRLSSKRIAYISELRPDFYVKNHHILDIIENIFGGTVVIDLSAMFGHEASEYVAAAKYIENIFRKHRNHCLFIFTYNMNNVGFSYFLLPKIRNLVPSVTIKEGKGNRKAATQYLKSLVNSSECESYAKYINEFMNLYTGDEFTQTEIIEAQERFEPWCINKRQSGIYGFDTSDSFMLDRDDDTESSSEKLDKLIGLSIVKKQTRNIIATDIVDKERRKRGDKDYESISSHMIFAGNPGSAKTTVAKLFAGVAKEKGILKSGVFVERGGMDLDGMFCVPAIREAFVAAKGGVLFIDEAYSMKSSTAIATLIQEMENHRDEVIVILAGYGEKMREFLERNDGLKSRIPNWIDFPDYSTEELTEIFKYMLGKRHLDATEDAINAATLIFDRVRLIENFGNGRYVRNLLDRALMNQSDRLLSSCSNVSDISKKELYTITVDDITSLHEGLQDTRKAGEAKDDLDIMIGLDSAKEVVSKAIAKFKLDKLCIDRGLHRDPGTMHMVFTGNPGTAKTTIARLCAEILRDEKILSTGVFVEAGRADLVGNVVGSTAILVKNKFKEAQGGVLFIDEAYSLCDSHEGSFGDEAINTIVQEMENHREDVVVIFAGYPKPMQEFLERNPGMKSRIAFHVKFEDYSTDELCEIAQLMLQKKELNITDAAMDKIRRTCEAARVNSDFGNGRFVRQLLEEAEMNLAGRIDSIPADELTIEMLTTIEESDIPERQTVKTVKNRIGFAF